MELRGDATFATARLLPGTWTVRDVALSHEQPLKRGWVRPPAGPHKHETKTAEKVGRRLMGALRE
eukprot:COSAG04_NODE_689_length_11142_cov_6.664041_3_plen_65_part_00